MNGATPRPEGLIPARRRPRFAGTTAPAAAVGTGAGALAAGGPLPARRGVVWSTARGRAAAALVGVTASFVLPLAVGPAHAGPVVAAAEQRLSTYIVRAQKGQLAPLVERLESLGQVTRQVPLIEGAVAELTPAAARALSGDRRVLSVSGDMAVQTQSYDAAADGRSEFNQQASAAVRDVWADSSTRKGVTGAGIDVAVIDTGVSPVAGLTGLNADGRQKLVNGPDLSFDSQDAVKTRVDLFGHGTAMAAIIAGRDAGAQPKTDRGNAAPYLGVAPDARIVSVKVGDSRGAVDVSQVIAGIDWVVQNARTDGMNIRVLNLSLGYPSTQDYRLDPLSYAAEQAWKKGIVVVASAGNDGTGTGRLMMPAANPFVLGVGAVDTNETVTPDDDVIPAFSTQGTKDRTPDLVAPGRSVQTIVPIDSAAALGNVSSMIDGRFLKGSGTSEAAAQVSGAVALVLEANPLLNPDQVKALLRSGATQLDKADLEAQGEGQLNVARSLSMTAPSQERALQSFPAGTGTGSLDAARGGRRIADSLTGVVLDGERDIRGNVYDSVKQASLQAQGASWSGGTWNGASWSGASWSGASWSGASWSGASWSGASWSGASWSGASWSGASWSGASWSGASWSGASWSTAAWQ